MTGAERKRVWRDRQKQSAGTQTETHAQASVRNAVLGLEPGTRRVDQFSDAKRDTLKILGAEIRLKHSLAADDEQRRMRAAVDKISTHLILRGMLPTLDVVKAILAGGKIPK